MSDQDLVCQISEMNGQEREDDYKCTNYMKYMKIFTPTARMALCHWSFTISDHSDICRSTVAKAICYFDRFMSTSSNSFTLAHSGFRTIQLAFITCLMIALKLEGKNTKLEHVSKIYLDEYNENEIIRLESEVLHALQGCLDGELLHLRHYVLYILQFGI